MKTVRCPKCHREREVNRGAAWAIRTGKSRGLCHPCADIIRYDEAREARFWTRVTKTATCWEWTGCKSRDGYGSFKGSRNRDVRAHRFAYELLVGPIPEGLELDHLCRNRGCVNPAHLEPVTRYENWRRGTSFSVANATKTHCPRGHEYTPENTYRLPRGARMCRLCKRTAAREWARQKRARVRAQEHASRHQQTFSLKAS